MAVYFTVNSQKVYLNMAKPLQTTLTQVDNPIVIYNNSNKHYYISPSLSSMIFIFTVTVSSPMSVFNNKTSTTTTTTTTKSTSLTTYLPDLFAVVACLQLLQMFGV